MESISKMGLTETGILEDQIITCNPAIESSIEVNSSVPNVQCNMSPNNTQIIPITEIVTETNFINEMPMDYEDSTLEAIENDSKNVATPHQNQLPLKAVSPTIFENAVKVVKNLFSPAKAHGIFSRGVSQQDSKQPEINKIPNGEIKIVNGNTFSKIDQLPVIEHKGSLSLTNFESGLCFNEEDAFNLVAKHFSNSVDPHNNTNDSYTSTVSRMEESFQSTVTHFDDCMQNEVGNSNNSTGNIENISVFDNSMNDTIDANEHSLNNTLKKNVNTSVVENGEVNTTFEVDEINELFIPENENKQICKVDARSIQESSAPCAPDIEESKMSKNIESPLGTAKEALELITEIVTFRGMEEKSLQEDNLTDITSSSTPIKQQTLEDTNRTNSPFFNYFSETLNDLEQKGAEDIVEDSYFYSLQNANLQNEESLSRSSAVAHSSEVICTDTSTSDNFLLEKSSSPLLCTSLEKNFSTSTIVISKNDLDNINSCKEKDSLVPKDQLSPIDHKSQINIDVITGDINSLTITGEEHSGGVNVDNYEEMGLCSNKSQLILKNIHTIVGENFNGSAPFNMTEFVKNCPLESKSFTKLDTEKTHISGIATTEIFDQNLESLNLENNFFHENGLELKSEECPTGEIEIPLASQKSYTVLHNVNSNLNLPVVPDNTCDIQADKLNDIILGNRAFSDLSVLCNKNIYSDELIIPHNQIDSGTTDYVKANTDRISTDMPPNINSDNIDLKACNLEIPNRAIMNTADKLEFIRSLSLSCLESHTAAVVEPEKETSEYFEQKGGSNSVKQSNNASELSNDFSEKRSKTENTVVKPENSAVPSRNSPDADILFLTGKEEDKTIKKSHSELQLSPEIIHISSGEAAKESYENIVISSNICGDGDSLSSGYFDGSLEKNDFRRNSYTKDYCGNEEVVKDISLNAESNNMKNMESEVKVETDCETPTLQIDLDKIISDFERLKMNDSATEKPNTCYSDSDNPLCITSKLNDSVDLDDTGLSENNVKAFNSVTELTQLIKEQFSVTDIEKICSVVDDIPTLNLSKNIALASQQFDKSFHGNILNESDNNVMKANNLVIKDENDLDFLDSIKGKPSNRDYSRESLYIKFDPLVQSKQSPTLLDISEGDKENINATPINRNNNTSDPLIPITPLKQSINMNVVSPLTPASQNNESKLSTEKLNKLRELQNEISRLREHYLQGEEIHKEKMNNYENVIAELTGKASVLEDKLKESEEIEKLLLKKLNTQNESMSRLRNTIEECMTYINKLTDELQKSRKDNQKQISALTVERDYYMNHLQMTEQAFSSVFNKYEKCKEAVTTYKKNEEIYKLNIENLEERIEQYSEKIRDMQENAAKEASKLQEKINDLKLNQSQEISKYKAQLRITELKVQTMQEALEQKIKENQELAGICDELIESKECDR